VDNSFLFCMIRNPDLLGLVDVIAFVLILNLAGLFLTSVYFQAILTSRLSSAMQDVK